MSISFSNNGRKSFSGKEVQIQYAALDIYWNIFSSTATEFYDEDPQVVAFMMNTFFKKEVLDRLNSGMIDKLYFLLKICKENFPATSVKDVQKEFTEYEYIDFFIDLSVDILRPNLPICREQRILVNILARLSITKIESEETSLEQYKLLKKQTFLMFFIQEKWWSPFVLYLICLYLKKKRFFTHWHSHEINFIMDFLTSINQIRPFLLSCFIKNIAY